MWGKWSEEYKSHLTYIHKIKEQVEVNEIIDQTTPYDGTLQHNKKAYEDFKKGMKRDIE
jgi:hypothetical protein